MFAAALDFSTRAFVLALRMLRYAWPAVAGVFVLTSFLGGDYINPVLLAALFVIVPILFSLHVCIGFALYHGESPLNRPFLEYAVRHTPAVLGVVMSVAIGFALAMMVPLGIVTAAAPQLGLVIFLPFLLIAQLFTYIAMARLVNTDKGVFYALKSSFEFVRHQFGFLMLASVFVVLLPLGIDMGVDLFALQFRETGGEIVIFWRYLVQAPVTALMTSITCAAGVIAVVEGDWSNVTAPE